MMESAAVWVHIDDLVEWAENPRINDQSISRVADSIRRFGFSSPIVARKADSQIIAGHTRYAAARSLGLEQVPVRYMDLDPVDAKLLALADNKLGELSEWNTQGLSDVLNQLSAEGAKLGISIGWTAEEIEDLLKGTVDVSGIMGPPPDESSAEASQSPTGDSEIPLSQTRMIQLFYDADEHAEMMEGLRLCAEHFDTENVSDTIKAAVDYICSENFT